MFRRTVPQGSQGTTLRVLWLLRLVITRTENLSHFSHIQTSLTLLIAQYNRLSDETDLGQSWYSVGHQGRLALPFEQGISRALHQLL
jgi:hypothetical protein